MAEQQVAEAPAEQQATAAEWRPTLLAYLCNWCSYAGANLAGASRMPYDASIRVIRVPCSGRVDPLMIYKAFERGADGVLVGGCHLGDCHYSEGNYACQGRMALVKALLAAAGIEEKRFRLEWISASEGSIFQAVVNEMSEQLRELGPFELK
ncbi:MAG: hydrogenase iron-sulfur subunit [Armatimonadetes bacterium]|nr:hydrogenase iron-sulfur subunit [Armatimonadota bacterium]